MSTTSASFLSGLQVSRYFNVAGLAVWVFDYCITFETEVLWVWGRKWQFTRIIFTLSRYVPLVGASMTVYTAVINRSGNCVPFNNAANIIHIIGIVAAEVLLLLRTYAFWKSSKKLLAWLVPFAVAITIGAIVVPTQVTAPEGYPNPGSCIFFDGRTGSIVYGFILVFEILLLFLNIYKQYQYYHTTNNQLIVTLYRDGVMYMVCIILITLLNIIVTVTVPVGYINSLDTLQIVSHSVLASRILFNLRQTNARRQVDTIPLSFISTGSEWRADARESIPGPSREHSHHEPG